MISLTVEEFLCGLSDGETLSWVDCAFIEEPSRGLKMMMTCSMAGHDSMCSYSCSTLNSREPTVNWNVELLIQRSSCVLEVDSNSFAIQPKSHLQHCLHHHLQPLHWFVKILRIVSLILTRHWLVLFLKFKFSGYCEFDMYQLTGISEDSARLIDGFRWNVSEHFSVTGRWSTSTEHVWIKSIVASSS